MEDLTKQQIILLTLLVSFVTSIATGIVTVSILDQAPQSVTQTINRIVERTIERVTPDTGGTTNTAAVPITFEDQTALASEKVSKSVVRIKQKGSNANSVKGMGLLISKEGIVVTDKSVLGNDTDLVAVLNDEGSGTPLEFHIRTIQSQINGDIVFVQIIIPNEMKSRVSLTPLAQASSIKLGQTVLALSGKDSFLLKQGIVERVEGTQATTTSVTAVITTIPKEEILLGSPLFNISGEVIGLKTLSVSGFYPLALLKGTIPVLTQ